MILSNDNIPKDQNYVRLSNTHMILHTIEQHRPISRAELAKLTRMSPTSVTRLVADLQEIGIVQETDVYSRGVGRRAVMLDIVSSALYTVGIHIDNNALRVNVVDFLSNTVAMKEIKEPQMNLSNYQPEDIANICFKLYRSIIVEHNVNPEKVIGMCIGIVGIADPISRSVLISPQFSWKSTPIADVFEKVFCLSAILENDAKASLIGQMALLDILSETDTAVLNIGTGVGSAVSVGGTIIRGKQNAAGEIGHIISDYHDGLLCECGRQGCLQTHMAIPYLIKKAQKNDINIRNLTQLKASYDKGEKWAIEIIDDCNRHICFSLDILMSMYNPAKIIISGSFTGVFWDVIPKVIDNFYQLVQVSDIKRNDILCSGYHEVACAIGCAMIARKEYLPAYLKAKILT